MLKVIEVLAESNQSWEDAAKQAIADAAKTVRNIKSIWIENFEATVDATRSRAIGSTPRFPLRLSRPARDKRAEAWSCAGQH
jgi:hypothetical protein